MLITSRRVIPIGTSITPLKLTLPMIVNTFVPGLDDVPNERYHSAPLRMIAGMFASVSTLLTSVGLFHKPRVTGYGGRERGSPRLPSIDSISAVSSPQTYAPAPVCK